MPTAATWREVLAGAVATLLLATTLPSCAERGSTPTRPAESTSGRRDSGQPQPPATKVVLPVPAAPLPVVAPSDPGPEGPVPAGFALFPTGPNGSALERATCGDYTVLQQEHGRKVALARADGSIAFEVRHDDRSAPLASFEVGWCYDVTGDGVPELLIRDLGGGLVCCHTETVLSLGPRIVPILRFADDGNGGGLRPFALGGSAPYELVGVEDSSGARVHLFCGAHGFRPFLPVVYAMRRGRYRRATAEFPAFLRALRTRDVAAMSDPDGDVGTFCQFGGQVLAISLLLGDWDVVKATLPPDPSGVYGLRELEAGRAYVSRRLARRR